MVATINVRLGEIELERLDSFAKANGLTRSHVVKESITSYLDKADKATDSSFAQTTLLTEMLTLLTSIDARLASHPHAPEERKETLVAPKKPNESFIWLTVQKMRYVAKEEWEQKVAELYSYCQDEGYPKETADDIIAQTIQLKKKFAESQTKMEQLDN